MQTIQTRQGRKRLTDALVRSAKKGKHFDGGGLGLYLRVEENGARFFVQRITIGGRRREIGLGAPPVVTLAMAREAALDNKRLARSGVDPISEKRKKRDALTFKAATEKFLVMRVSALSNEKHRKQWRATLETYAFPVLGEMHVADIEPRDVVRAVHPIWQDKPETASRVRQRIEAVLSWTTAAGHRTGDNPARWKGNLSEMLPAQRKRGEDRHRPAVALEDAPRFFAALRTRDGMAARALELCALTGARSGEVRGATWDEIDFDKALWRIPAKRMKAGRPHTVPLSDAALALLRSLPRIGKSNLLFPAERARMLSDMAMLQAMRRIHAADIEAGNRGFVDPQSKRPAVPHGLRSTFRQWAAECGYDRHMAELQLAHEVGSEVERAYQRSDMLERRREMMARYDSFLLGDAKS